MSAGKIILIIIAVALTVLIIAHGIMGIGFGLIRTSFGILRLGVGLRNCAWFILAVVIGWVIAKLTSRK